jgi:hypothetical protein
MSGRSTSEQRRIEAADVDALACASLHAHLRVLVEEAYITGNWPRFRRLEEMHKTVEAMRLRAIARKGGEL